MHTRRRCIAPVLLLLGALTQAAALREQPLAVPMPPGILVEISEFDGPVFADARGLTLYAWPFKTMRSGVSGESKGRPACFGKVLTETAGHMSPYPPGEILPELKTRPSCTDLWHPAVAGEAAQAVGKWSILTRSDGIRQWAYDEQPLYTSGFDQQPGDDFGGTTRRDEEDQPAVRKPVGPPSRVPPGFAVKTTLAGRLLGNTRNESVYTFDQDRAGKSACEAECAKAWQPLAAPLSAFAQGEWSVLERSPGVKQWVFRGQPLYTHFADTHSWSLEGGDVAGWHNVYTQRAPWPERAFRLQDTAVGQVLADPRGMTLYAYVCADDSQDQLSCDHPDDVQLYRLAICGGGDAKACLLNWPYVRAADDAVSDSRLWSILNIDPVTGHRAPAGARGAIRVWAYRDRPIYTYARDLKPGDVNGDGVGEWRGQRNGLKAFWMRDDFFVGNL